jgi:hypothetical protein
LAVSIGGDTYTWPFIRADVKFPLLVIDFLRCNEFVIDVALEQLVRKSHAVKHQLSAAPVAAIATASVETDQNEFRQLLSKFAGVLEPLSGQSQPNHSVQHRIVMSGSRRQ